MQERHLEPARRERQHKALVGRQLYRVALDALMDRKADAAERVVPVLQAHPSDAMTFGPDRRLYLTAVDRASITRWRPGTTTLETVVSDARLAWPVGLTFGPKREIYTTVGRIHEGSSPSDRYRLYRFDPEA